MHILCVGINHATAPLHIREQFAFDSAFKPSLTESLMGLIVLSTCNRVELYAASYTKDFSSLEELLAKHGGVDQLELSQYVYQHTDEVAAGHLMRVAAGLDSVVLGEPQILGQITHSLQFALDENTTTPLLTKLFQKAIHAGKPERNETGIARNPTSIAGVAVRLASESLANLPAMQAAVPAAGETASLIASALRQRGV